MWGNEKRRVEAELKRLNAEEVEIAALDVQRVYRREVLHGRMAKLNLRRDELQMKLKELNEQERLVEEASEIEGWIRAYCERLREGLDELDFNGKRQVLAALGVRVYATMMVSAYGDEENARRAEASGARGLRGEAGELPGTAGEGGGFAGGRGPTERPGQQTRLGGNSGQSALRHTSVAGLSRARWSWWTARP